jgi:hypothetical protein
MTVQEMDWPLIGAPLRAPFPPDQVDWRSQGKTGSNMRGRLVDGVSGGSVACRRARQAWQPV